MVINLAAELASRKIPVLIATLRTGWFTEELDRLQIKHKQIYSRKGFDILLPIRIAITARRFGATLIHSHLLDSNFYCAIAARMACIKHIATEHGDVHHSDSRRYVSQKLQLITRLGSKLVAVSAYTAKQCAEIGKIKEPTVIPNPIPRTKKIFDSDRSLVRSQLTISEDEFLWINVANLRPVKDQGTLLRAFAQSLRDHPQQKLLILGEGPERGKLEQLRNELGLSQRVILKGHEADVGRFLASSDGFVLSSLSEAMPMSVIEAMSYGLPIVATAVGGIPEIISDDLLGLLATSGDFDSLSKCLSRMVSDRSLAAKIGANVRTLSQKFSASRIVDDYLRLVS